MIAKLGQGLSRQQVARDLACVPSTVVKTARRFVAAGEEGLLDQRVFNGRAKVDARFLAELERVLHAVPTEFGWQRTTWTRELLGLELERRRLPKVAPCTMGRALSTVGARLKAPRPIVLCPWQRERRLRVLAAIRRLEARASAEEFYLPRDFVRAWHGRYEPQETLDRVLRWSKAEPHKEPARADKAPGRNDPCTCGSGKKWKKCHGAPGAAPAPAPAKLT